MRSTRLNHLFHSESSTAPLHVVDIFSMILELFLSDFEHLFSLMPCTLQTLMHTKYLNEVLRQIMLLSFIAKS